MSDNKPYLDALSSGQYAKKSGLTGKYDNVRRFWEDQVTAEILRPYLEAIVAEKASNGKGLSILDLGCGVGDGYDLLTCITRQHACAADHAVRLLDQGELELYTGVDINARFIMQARELYGQGNGTVFMEGDFSDGLPVKNRPFDLYFTSYGTLSHNHDSETIRMLGDIASTCGDHAVIMCDWLGRYSYEWRDLWSRPAGDETHIDYRISYIYPPEERKTREISSFPLRMLCRDEVTGMVKEASRMSGIPIRIREIADKSVFVGRHTDTAEYNEHCPPLRAAVNSLYEHGVRTDLDRLLVEYVPSQGYDELNDYFSRYAESWNHVVRTVASALQEEEPGAAGNPRNLPDRVNRAASSMADLARSVSGLYGDTRANIIEPALAETLRSIEMSHQQGLGTGHALVAILEIEKTSS